VRDETASLFFACSGLGAGEGFKPQLVVEYLLEEDKVLRERLDFHAKGKLLRYTAKQEGRHVLPEESAAEHLHYALDE